MAEANPTMEQDRDKVLMVAYVFPPFYSVGGSIRVVKFAKYLPALGWMPMVLTIDDKQEYEHQRKLGSEALLAEIPDSVEIYRTGAGEPTVELLERGRAARRKSRLAGVVINALSTLRQLANDYLFLPDRYITWLPQAVRAGRQIVAQEQPDVILATCPPYSAALIGATLKRLTGKPLLLDFRDDWIDTPPFWGKPKAIRALERRMEAWAVRMADKVVLVTEWSQEAFRTRYPKQPASKFVFIANGCDLADFEHLETEAPPSDDGRFTIAHAGRLDDHEYWKRDPRGLFKALLRIRQERPQLASKLRLAFTGHLPATYQQMVAEMDLADTVEELGHLPGEAYPRFLQQADLLLAINYEDWSTIIPGKLYEYWAVGGAPILLLDRPGAAQSLVQAHDLGHTVDPDDVQGIYETIVQTYEKREQGQPDRISRAGLECYDRQVLTEKLAQVLSDMVKDG